jgi:hypothetical protein
MRALGVLDERPTAESESVPKEIVGKVDDHDDRPTDALVPDSTNRDSSHPSKAGPERESDESGDIMVEEAEDTVIY